MCVCAVWNQTRERFISGCVRCHYPLCMLTCCGWYTCTPCRTRGHASTAHVHLYDRRWRIPSAHSRVRLPLQSVGLIEPRSSNPSQLARLVTPFTTSFSHCDTPRIDLYTFEKEIHATEQSPRLFGIVKEGGKRQCVLTSVAPAQCQPPDAGCTWHRRTPRIPHVSQLVYYTQPYSMTLHVLSIGSG